MTTMNKVMVALGISYVAYAISDYTKSKDSRRESLRTQCVALHDYRNDLAKYYDYLQAKRAGIEIDTMIDTNNCMPLPESFENFDNCNYKVYAQSLEGDINLLKSEIAKYEKELAI
jgi:hypothetical protein